MSPTLRPPEEVGLKRTAMSTRELRRAEVLARVKSETLRLVDAAKMLEVSYRQAKRLWQRYREEGEIPAEGAAAHPGEVFRDGTEAIWAHAGSGTFSGRGWAGSGRGDVATLDVSGGGVEPPAETESAPEAEGAPAALWRLGAAGWKLSRLVRGTWTSGMSDEYGG